MPTMNSQASIHRTVRAPITARDLEDTSHDTLFLVIELSDAMRRGVEYFSLGGIPLDCLNEVLDALISDGEIVFDDDRADGPVGH